MIEYIGIEWKSKNWKKIRLNIHREWTETEYYYNTSLKDEELLDDREHDSGALSFEEQMSY